MRFRKWQVRMKWYEGDEVVGPYFFESTARDVAASFNAPFGPWRYAFVERIED